MKILLVHKFFNYVGGAEVFFFEVGRVLKEHGHQVAYFSTNSPNNLESEWNKYFSDAPSFKDCSLLDKLNAFFKIPYNYDAKKKFEQLIQYFRPDLIHCFGIMTHISPSILVAAKEYNIPVVVSFNDYKHICPNYKLLNHGKICEECTGGKYYNCLKNRCAHDSFVYSLASTYESYVHQQKRIYDDYIDLYLFASDFMADKTEEFWRKNINKGKLMNPFNVPAKPEFKPGDYGLYFGRLINEKGVDVLLKALSLCKECPFIIVGNGPDEKKLREYASANKLQNVKFVGPKWGVELDEILNNSKYVVVPSTWHENFPYVILQAFAAGKPVIGSLRGGIPELIGNDRGYLYDAYDYRKLAEFINMLNDNSLECISIGKRARKYVEETFNDDEFYKAIQENYKKIIDFK